MRRIEPVRYMQRYRRTLLEIHIPDFDERFLERYDPVRMAKLYQRAKVNAVMFYCKSHTGLCNWPTTVERCIPPWRVETSTDYRRIGDANAYLNVAGGDAEPGIDLPAIGVAA